MDTLINLVNWYIDLWTQYNGGSNIANIYGGLATISLIVAVVSVILGLTGVIGKNKIPLLAGQQVGLLILPFIISTIGIF